MTVDIKTHNGLGQTCSTAASPPSAFTVSQGTVYMLLPPASHHALLRR